MKLFFFSETLLDNFFPTFMPFSGFTTKDRRSVCGYKMAKSSVRIWKGFVMQISRLGDLLTIKAVLVYLTQLWYIDICFSYFQLNLMSVQELAMFLEFRYNQIGSIKLSVIHTCASTFSSKCSLDVLVLLWDDIFAYNHFGDIY